MATKGQALDIYFRAFNTSTNTPEEADAGNISMFVSKDGGAVAGIAGTVVEVNATNMPGIYTFVGSSGELTADSVIYNGTSTTPDVVVDPVYIETEDVVNGVWEDDNTARATANSSGKALGDILADTDQIQQVTPATLISTQIDVQALSNNTKARISVGDPIQIPNTGNTIFPVDFYFFDSSGVGVPNDPDNNEVAIQIRAINAQVLKTALFDDEAGSTGATASSTFTGFWKLNRLGTGRYQTFYKLPSSESADQWNLKFQLEESAVLLEYPQNIGIAESLASIELDDSVNNRQIIAKSLKVEDVSSEVDVSGSVYKDLKDEIDSIVVKLPAGTISDYGLATASSDGVTTEQMHKLLASMFNGRMVKNFPAAGNITFFERDNTTVLSQVTVTTSGRTRDI